MIRLFFIILLSVSIARGATSVSRFNITWTFQDDETVGQFVNGDWWVIGPVTITSITRPSADSCYDGSMINPDVASGDQGYDCRGWDGGGDGYNASKNVANSLPLTLNSGDSLVSTISLFGPSDLRPLIEYAAVLTVVSSDPGSDKFRPSYVGTTKTLYSSSNLQTQHLLSLDPVANTPSLATLESYFGSVLLDHQMGWTGEPIHPFYSSGDPNDTGYSGHYYAAAIAKDYGDVVLRLMLNDSLASKQALLIKAIQRGIDNYGLVSNGARWDDISGAMGVGRKLPVIFAGLMLNDAAMKNFAVNNDPTTIWQEDSQPFYNNQDARDADDIVQTDPNSNWPGYYDQWPIGFPVWGEFYWPWYHGGFSPSYYAPPGKIDYLGIVHKSTIGTALAVHLLNIRSTWNGEAFLDWTDAAVAAGQTGGYDSAFSESMWTAYRNYSFSTSQTLNVTSLTIGP